VKLRQPVGASVIVVATLAMVDTAAAQGGGHAGGGQTTVSSAPFRASGVYVPDSSPAGPGGPSRGGGSGRFTPPGYYRPSDLGTPFRKRPWLWPLTFYNGIGLDYFYDDGPLDPDAYSPEDAAPGGLQLDVEPRHADVYIDGQRAGTVGDFSGYYKHLELPSGLHRVMVLADGYQPLVFDMGISPGRTSTYRGALMRSSGR